MDCLQNVESVRTGDAWTSLSGLIVSMPSSGGPPAALERRVPPLREGTKRGDLPSFSELALQSVRFFGSQS